MAGCATRVSVSAACCAASVSASNAAGGKMYCDSRRGNCPLRLRSACSSDWRISSMNSAVSRPMLTYCAPWPGNTKATFGASAGVPVLSFRCGGSACPLRRCAMTLSRSAARAVKSLATSASRTGAAPRLSAARASASASSARRSVPGAPSTGCSWPICCCSWAVSAARNTISSCGHWSCPAVAPWAPTYSSSTAWKLVPPNPKAETPARRG